MKMFYSQPSRNVPMIRNKECIGNGEIYYERNGKSKSKIVKNGSSEEETTKDAMKLL
jgi:hypothetical protein